MVIGNPPYNAFAGVSPEEELGLVDPYKKGLNRPVSEEGGWGIKKFNLDDLYVRFYRLAERKITEMSGKGVVSFISNFSYLSDPSFVVMRKRFLDEFDFLWFDCMNGDSRETGKLTPTGAPDPSVFSTEYNREGIRVGTAVCVMVRKESRAKPATVRFRQYWGVTKRQDLLHSLEHAPFDELYEPGNPNDKNRYSFRPENVSSAYMTWPKLTELCGAAPSNGLMEKRGGALISIDREALETRMRDYFDPDLTWEDYRARYKGLTEEQAGFNPVIARSKAISKEKYNPARIVKYAVRPFETRWCYYTQINPIWNRARPALWEQSFPGNAFVLSRTKPSKDPEGAPFYFCRILSDDHLLSPDASCFPIRLAPKGYKDDIERQQGSTVHMPLKANLSAAARGYLSAIGIDDPDTDENLDALVWLHSLAIGYSPAYLNENADGIRSDWPRLPFPSNKKLLVESASLGRHVAELLDTESQATGVTGGGDMEPVFLLTGVVQRVGGGQLDPNSGDLDVTAGWGHAGKDGVTMPARGAVRERLFTTEEKAAIAAAAKGRGIDAEKAAALVGPDTRDVYLNEHAFWKNVPASAWEFYIGGYQVIKKWLSYRERDLLGRAMKVEEVVEVTTMARRLTALVLLRPTLDDNYRKVKGSPFAWEQGSSVT